MRCKLKQDSDSIDLTCAVLLLTLKRKQQITKRSKKLVIAIKKQAISKLKRFKPKEKNK